LSSQHFMAESALLVALIEELKPQRILSVHAHRQKPDFFKGIGDNAGIFVDPRPGAEKEDDALAFAMIQAFSVKYHAALGGAARARVSPPPGAPLFGPDFSWDPLRGNRSFFLVGGIMGTRAPVPATNVRYASDDKTGAPPGTSFGTWGPRPVQES